MKCFDVVRLVLDATYNEVPGDETSRDASIKNALQQMSDQYRNHVKTAGGPDFNDPTVRFAYVFQHVPAHAHWLFDLLSDCDPILDVLKNGKARIACIGGGPGSDLVGILKLLHEQKIECGIFCELFDGCEAWKITWGDLAFELDVGTPVHTDYIIHDVANEQSWQSPSHITKADLITLSFFVSEIFHQPLAAKYLTKMLSSAKQGAIVVVNDIRDSDVMGLIDGVASDTGFSIHSKGDGQQKIYDAGEDMSKLKKYTEKFGRGSKLTGYNAWRIYQKT